MALASTADKLLSRQPYVVLDLRGVSYSDTSGVGLLLRLRTVAQNAAGDVKLSAASPRVRAVLRVIKLDGVLRMHDSDEEAVAAFYSRTDATQDQAPLEVDVVFVHPSADVLAYGSG